jgi:preprotein translocase subunit YajC
MAQTAQQAQQQPGLAGFLPLIIIFVIFYFLMIRPQTKRAKEHKAMVAALAKGDEIVTNGGLLGKVTNIGETFITVEIADNVSVKIQRDMVSNLMPKGTIKES